MSTAFNHQILSSFMSRSFLFSFLFLFLQFNIFAQNSNLVWLDNGTLSYAPFAMEGQSNLLNTIPDFSFAGYKGGGVSLPVAPVILSLSSTGGDDTQMIQNAIDQVEALPLDANGFRGAILLTAGCYEINQLYIEESGVVLRGEGQGIDGTVLYAQLATQHDVITVQGSGSGIQRLASSQQEITSSYVPVGANSFEVADASSYSVGDTIVVVRTPNQFWIDELGMDETTLCGGAAGCVGWTPSSYTINHERIITAISANTISVDIPIVDVMETQYGGGEIYKASISGRIEQCGVEHLRIESYYDPNNEEDESHAWIGIHFKRVVNSWVQNVTGQHLGFGIVSISDESNFNTIQECAVLEPISIIAGGRRYSFNIADGIGNLFQRNYTRGGRHDFVTSSRLTGPNVFLDSYSDNTFSDIGPHHRWATGLLYDNIRGGQIRVQNRGSSGSGHGWAGNTTMFWNLLSYSDDIKVESPKGGINWGIGCRGIQQNGSGYWDNWNSNVQPRSLYLQQLEDRLGAQAVANITIPEQLTGDIYNLLQTWAGEFDFGTPATTQKVFVTEDAYVRGGIYGDTNYGTDDELIIKENSGSADNDRMSFIKIDLSQIGATIYNVKLRLFVSNDPANPADNSLHFVSNDSWTESGITWNNQPVVTSLLETKAVPADDEWLEYDITSIANSEINGDGILSLRLSEATINNFYSFASKDEVGTGFDPHVTYQLTAGTPPVPSCNNAVLPVSWESFSLRKEEESARLDWSTTNEINHDFFVVEWSTNGHSFTELETVKYPKDRQASTSQYVYLHQNPRIGINYYRIKQIDLDGSISYSTVKSLNFQYKDLEDSFSLFPNPTNDIVQLSFPPNHQVNEIQLYTARGELIYVQRKNSQDLNVVLDLSDLAQGIYLLRVGAETKRLVKSL